MFVVEQRNIFIVSNSTAMEVKSDAGSDHDQNETHVKIKVNKPNTFDGDRRKLEACLIQIKLYERAIERRYSGRHSGREGHQVEQRGRNARFGTSRNQKRSDDTMFMKLNTMLFRKFKNKKKKKKKKKTTCYPC